MDLNHAVAENIKRIRKAKKLSMERTAELSGVSRSMLGQIERGEANPSVAILGKLAAALKVPAEILLENDSFESLLLSPELDNKPVRKDGGKAVLRQSFPFDECTRLESSFLDLYISAQYEPPVSIPGCVCHDRCPLRQNHGRPDLRPAIRSGRCTPIRRGRSGGLPAPGTPAAIPLRGRRFSHPGMGR